MKIKTIKFYVKMRKKILSLIYVFCKSLSITPQSGTEVGMYKYVFTNFK